MKFEGIGEVDMIELAAELLIGECMYRVEVLKGIHRHGVVPGLLADAPFSARFYKREDIKINLADISQQEPTSACIWVKCRVDNSHNHATPDVALEEAILSLVKEAKSMRI